jgi:hypothetical protein
MNVDMRGGVVKGASRLPKICRWIFTVLSACCALAVLALAAVMVIDPHIPANGHATQVSINSSGVSVVTQPIKHVEVELNVSDLSLDPGVVMLSFNDRKLSMAVTQVKGDIALKGGADGVLTLVKRKFVPLGLVDCLFLAVLFDLLRRLFRNVERGDSFTEPNIRLVQIVGVSLMVFALASGALDFWASREIARYFVEHVTVPGGTLHVAPPEARAGLTLDSAFFAGLLVLALAEVFRQGLALKRENELTV